MPAEPAFHRRYRSLVGGLCWLGPTARPDVLFATGICARAFTFPTQHLYDCAVRILVYCYHTSILISASLFPRIRRTRRFSLRSVTAIGPFSAPPPAGACYLLEGAFTLSRAGRNAPRLLRTTAHAEIVAASSLASDVEHARRFLDDLNLPQAAATVLHVDNKAVYDVSRNYTATKNLRHLDRRAFRVRDLCFADAIEVRLLSTDHGGHGR
eukprot:CAMPEP_0182825558 /NCGR_PEP_ID=MMETSP0006_2-20121128/15903_1 /TAXON_ID=97485 /ORGANISM="Prymnesium parvum, Strain Texoma1" /LENGTH=210 /DNA_ID=CAMNT_0024952661 /DNA_START=228 /DNA_END=860 /DNA_ORIENTATION=+